MWYLNVVKNKIMECEIIEDLEIKPLIKIKEIESNKIKFLISNQQLFNTRDDVLVSLFSFLGNRFDEHLVLTKYNIDSTELKRCLEIAINRNPEKFI